MKGFLKEVDVLRDRLKNVSERKKLWRENSANFEGNVYEIVRKTGIPKGWKVYLTASFFINGKSKKTMPYDYDSWSTTNLIAASKTQGYESMIFINKARAGFLSKPALIPLIFHELGHVKQAAKSPKKYYRSLTDDKLSAKEESDADENVRKLPKKLRDQAVIEDIFYCYDLGGWKSAKKMADFLFLKRDKIYGGGYDKEMTAEEYECFLHAKKHGRISLFLESFN